MKDVVFVTGNAEKALNFSRQMGTDIEHVKIDLDELQSINPNEIIEHKLKQAYEHINRPVLVEDVSFVFSALNDTLPGPFIKYFVLTENGDEKICRMLDGFNDRGATASCVYGYYDGINIILFANELKGEVAHSPRGSRGYGFDRIFIPESFGERTAAELSEEEYDDYYASIKPFNEIKEFLNHE